MSDDEKTVDDVTEYYLLLFRSKRILSNQVSSVTFIFGTIFNK